MFELYKIVLCLKSFVFQFVTNPCKPSSLGEHKGIYEDFKGKELMECLNRLVTGALSASEVDSVHEPREMTIIIMNVSFMSEV